MSEREDLAADIARLGDAARAVLDERHEAREVALRVSRKIIQACAASIRAVHREEYDDAVSLADEAKAYLAEGEAAVAAHPDLRYAGYYSDAAKEYAEARITLALVRGDRLPMPEDVGVEVAPYLNGLAEAASELRRRLLDQLRAGHLEHSEALLGAMDEVYTLLVTIDYPDAVSGGLRRRTDALRAVLERTRSDVTTTILQARLQDAIESRLPRE
ncbi:MAG TPA: haloacid dehalogenase [Acidimicrobiia bacterium]|nr:haloacid dehalogenase [Acidimicrobiia bacterium]